MKRQEILKVVLLALAACGMIATLVAIGPAAVAVPVPDDCGDTAATACNWSDLGTPINGNIEIINDSDWYKFTATSSGYWSFEASAPAGGNTDTYGVLHDASGAVIASNDDANGSANRHFLITANLTANATYYLEVKDYWHYYTGRYTVNAWAPGMYTRWGTWAETTAAAGGETKQVRIVTDGQWWIYARDYPWITASPSEGTGTATITITFAANNTGETRLGSFYVQSSLYSQSIIDVTQDSAIVINDDCGNTAATACNWSDLGTPANGNIETTSDSDWFKVTPTVSGYWTFEASAPAGGNTNTYGILHAADGSVIAENDDTDGANNRHFTITANLTANTTYYLEVKWNWAKGRYTVNAWAPGMFTRWGTQSNVTAAPAGQTMQVRIVTTGDWYMYNRYYPWITASPSEGSGNATVTLTIAANTTGDVRTGSVYVQSSIYPQAYIDFTQESSVTIHDDCGNTAATACDWSNLGTPVNGNIEKTGDSDWFKVTPTVSGYWTFEASAPAGGNSNTYGVLHRADGSVIAENDNAGGSQHFTITAELTANTTYYLEVKDYWWYFKGQYTVNAWAPGMFTRWGTQSNVTAAPAGQTMQVRIVTTGDWYMYNRYYPWITASPSEGSGNATVTLTIAANTTGDVRTGSVYVQSSIYPQAYIDITQDSSVTIVDDCGNNASAACSWLNLGNPVNGNIEKTGDSDWFKIVPATSGSWTFTASAPAGGNQNTYGVLHRADGSVIAENDNANGSLHFAITADLTASTTYYLEVKDYWWYFKGQYTVTATAPAAPADDCGNTVATACNWSNLAAPVIGTLEKNGDSDWYKITPTVSGRWTFTSSAPAGGTKDPYGVLRDSNGNWIVANDDSNGTLHFSVSYYMTAGATYYLDMWDAWGHNPGAYLITATPPV